MSKPEDTLHPFKMITNLGRYIVLQCKNKQHARERFELECIRLNKPERIVTLESVQ